MSNLSNLYIEKTLSEHPIASWMLSDDLGYISLISEADRKFELAPKWTVTNATAYNENSLLENILYRDLSLYLIGISIFNVK